MAFTGHFLGKDKLEGLLKQGRQSREQINMTYKIMRRIEAEELSLDASEIVIASTRQEIEEQWNLYDGFEVILARKLRARVKRGANCYGRYMPRMVVSIHIFTPVAIASSYDKYMLQSKQLSASLVCTKFLLHFLDIY
jgi:sucrose-phosphate synthase